MTIPRIVLAFSGDAASRAAVRWLRDTHDAHVVAVTVDVGQACDLDELRARALACGAVRAHVVDRCDAFARDVVIPAASAPGHLDERMLRRLAHRVVAAALVEVAAIEDAAAVSYTSADSAFGEHIRTIAPALPVIAVPREVAAEDAAPDRGVSSHLLMRPPLVSAADSAYVTIAFERGIPVSVNGVTMELRELIESLSLIGGQYGHAAAPAFELLSAAYRQSGGRDSVTLHLHPGSPLDHDNADAVSALVNHA